MIVEAMKTGCFILHASNVHNGGGLTLLKALIDVLPDQACLIVDERLPIADDELSRFQLYRIKPTLWHRFKAEMLLKRLAGESDSVLCFGNLPPLFHLSARVTLFIQNRYLVEPESIKSAPLKLRLKLTIERLWLSCFQHNANKVLVQTPSMKALSCKYVSTPVIVAPFASSPDLLIKQDSGGDEVKKYDFIYVASGELHKNHRNLLDAWVELAKEGVFPNLCLTVSSSSFPQVAELIARKKKEYNLKIDNLGSVPADDVARMYCSTRTLIFPSILESFGLPLIEARNAGLKIVASELDYVRDLLDPEETFDPLSSVSIARAIRRLMKIEDKVFTLLTAEKFIELTKSD